MIDSNGIELAGERYYYLRHYKTNAPIVTVCLLKGWHGDHARGIAICSECDNPSKAEGRAWAKRRALRALKKRDASDPIGRPSVFSVFVMASVCSDSYVYDLVHGGKSVYCPVPLNGIEQKFFAGSTC